MRSREFISPKMIAMESIMSAHVEDWDNKPTLTFDELMDEMDRMEQEYDAQQQANTQTTG